MKSQKQPFAMGEVVAKNVQPDAAPSASLPPGRWALAARSTVPFALVLVDGATRLATWGEVVEVNEGTEARFGNGSAHAGDVVFVGLGSGGPPPPRPSTIVVPANFVQVMAALVYQSRVIDTRLARAAFCYLNALFTIPAGGVPWTITHRAGSRGAPFGPGTRAVVPVGTPSRVVSVVTVKTLGNGFPLGISAGDLYDAAGGMIYDRRPQALLDDLFVTVPDATANAAGFNAAGALVDAFVVLEY